MGFGIMLSGMEKFTIFLQFCRSNAFHRDVGTAHHVRVCQGTATKVINKVAKVLASAVPEVSCYEVYSLLFRLEIGFWVRWWYVS